MDNDWGSGFSGSVIISNGSQHIIEDWQISFRFDNDITHIWNGEILSHEGNHYVVKNQSFNQNIGANANVQFGFVVENGTSANEIYDVVVKSMSADADINVGEEAEESTSDSIEETEESNEDSTMEDEEEETESSDIETEIDNTEESSADESGAEESDTEESSAEDSSIENSTGEEDSTSESADADDGDGAEGDTDIDTSDDDSDMLNNFWEDYYGTDKNEPDSDNDGLTDYLEVAMLGTDPVKPDTDSDGIADGEEDLDEDGLNAKQELEHGTLPTKVDTDEDGLSDGDEVSIYGTNPINTDTDADGLKDGEDVKLSFDPTKPDSDENGVLDGEELLLQKVAVPIKNERRTEVVSVSVSMECAGDIENAVSITDMYGVDTYSSDVVGLIGVPVDINSTTSFESATITFRYDKEKLGDTKEEDLTILWYDEANREYVLLEDSVVDTVNHTVSYTTEHFSTYMLIDSRAWQSAWEKAIDYVKTQAEARVNYDIAVCFDYSVSEEEFTDAQRFVEGIIQQMESGDRIKFGVYVPNSLNTYYYATWITSKSVALNTLHSLKTDLYDNFGLSLKGNYYSENYQAISMLVDMTDVNSSNQKVGFLVNAGKNEDVTRYIYVSSKEQAKQNLQTLGFPVRAISVTKEMNEELDALLKEYSGNSYDMDSMWNIERKYGFDVPGVDELDSDGDGLLDVYEINGIRLSNGQVVCTDAQCVDTDGDGLTDYEELGGLYNAEIIYRDGKIHTCKVSRMNSHPLKEDTDGDDIGDEEELVIGTNSMSLDSDGDGLYDGIELVNWFDPLKKDADGDGRLDFREYVDGTDPFCYNKNWDEYATDFISGFFKGDFIEETDSVAVMAGQITGSFIPLIDARDVTANLIRGDYAFAGLSAIGLIPAGGDVTKAAGKVGKFMVKNVDDIPKVANLLEFLNKNCPEVVKVLSKNDDFLEAASQLSKADNIKLTRKQMYVITEAFENAGLSHYLLKTSNSIDLEEPVKIGSSVWQQGALARGNALDYHINKHNGIEGLGHNFPVADRVIKEKRILVSTKSLDIAAQSYQNPNRLKKTLEKSAEALEDIEKNYFNEAGVLKWGDTTLSKKQYDTKAIEVILPDVIISEETLKILNDFKKAMKKKNMLVWYRVTE